MKKLIKKIKFEFGWWVCDSKLLDWLEEYLRQSKYKLLSKLGFKLFCYRIGL